LFALAVDFGRAKARLSAEDVAELQQKLLAVPGAVGTAIASFEQVQPVAQHLKKTPSCLFLGRGRLYPLALEAALKLKELSYIHAEGFAAGEMKHGPIALIEDDLPVICLLDEDALSAKTISNLKEAEARGATIILIATQTVARQVDFASYKVVIEDCDPLLAPIILAVPAQILAYQTAFEKGTDVDQPRNLAKSVTVEVNYSLFWREGCVMEKQITFRPFDESDSDKVIALWEKAGLLRPWNNPNKDITRKLQEMAVNSYSWFWVAETDGVIIAAAMAGYDGHRGSVNYLGVDPDVQQSGIGRVIMQRIEADLIAAGCPKLNLQVRSDNVDVLAFYDRLDYQRDATLSLSKRLISDN
jgi:ribosomal protein S18 acetylase RimI-like enzyme